MVMSSLRPSHLSRYADIGRLIVKYARPSLLVTADLEGPQPDSFDPDVEKAAEKLAAELESLGPTYIKLGQLLSTRADVLPAPYLKALTRLQDSVEAVPFDKVREVVEAELGGRLSLLFPTFDEVPLAAASLGQVHRAVSRDGQVLAVKVQRPDIREGVLDDLAAIGEIADFVDNHTEIGKRFNFGGMVEEFKRSMLAELDYRQEARNLETLKANLADYPLIVVPQPIADFTTSRVLTMEYVPGKKVTSLGPLGRLELDGRPLAEELFRAYLHQVLVDGFFHADPHPGNVFLTDDGRLALLDLGMVGRIRAGMQDTLVRLLLAIGEGRGDEAAAAAIEMGQVRADVEFDRERFELAVDDLIARHCGAAIEGIAAGQVVAELTRLAGECGLRPAVELTMLGKALLNLDEVARTLAPDFEPDAAIREQTAEILRDRMRLTISPAGLASAAMEAKEFAEKLPGRVNKVMDALAEGQLTLNVQGIDENALMTNIQSVANRITVGVVTAALIMGAAMLMRVPTHAKLFGYPAVAIVCFFLAALTGVYLIVSILMSETKTKKKH
ncbi:MAG: ubiquinone biosynthesis protein [Actinomycetota bacterium]|jgi:predicted unusual protein kinase regulating ubiquinone biosynthesis (AarF/ABC1/UbiB family)|nr:ubiquinone biosynthesis protein [Actinomycetota bacterium]